MTTRYYTTSHAPSRGLLEHRAPVSPPPNLCTPRYNLTSRASHTGVSPSFPPRSLSPTYTQHSPSYTPRSPSPATPDKTKKVWVAVRLVDPDSLHSRKRSGDPTDTGGVFAAILSSDVLRREMPIRNPKKGRYACTREITAQFHLEDTSEFRVATVGVSTASGPFDREIRSAIYDGGFWAGAAYPGKRGGILDTQLCVSGAPNYGESLVDAARREVMEELGVAVELRPADLPARRDRKGVMHHLFWAVVPELPSDGA